jgi:hypothetical protein
LILALFALSALGLAAFGFVERAAGDKALVPSDVLRNRTFVAACLTVLMMSAIFFSALLFLPQFMSRVLHYNAMQSGLGLLPMMGVFALTSFISGPLYERLGSKLIISLGAAFLIVGIYLLSRRDGHHDLRGADRRSGRCSASASGSSIRRSPPPRSPRSIRRGRVSPAASSTCSRSPAARSASVSTPRWW